MRYWNLILFHFLPTELFLLFKLKGKKKNLNFSCHIYITGKLFCIHAILFDGHIFKVTSNLFCPFLLLEFCVIPPLGLFLKIYTAFKIFQEYKTMKLHYWA